MKRILKIFVAAALLSLPVFFLCGCQAEQIGGDDGTKKEDTGGDDSGDDDKPGTESEFALTATNLPSQIDVTLDGVTLYSMTFSYDDARRLSSYRRKSADCVLEDASITYKSATEAVVDYKQTDSEVSSTLSVRVSSGRLVWSYSNLNNGNRYSVLLDSGRWPSEYGYNVQFSGKKYTNRISYGAGYAYSDGNLVSSENTSTSESAASIKTVCSTVPDFADTISYLDRADSANLGSLALAVEFLPWYMKGIPGNKRLISKITHSSGGRTLDEFEEFKYEETDGKIGKMTICQYSGSTLLHTKEYKISY